MLKITENLLTPTYRDENNTRSMIDRYDTLGSTIHYTGNPGTTARGNRNYFNSGHDVNSTFILDDDDCLQCLPWDERPWTNGHSSNGWSITTETCHPDSSGKFTEKTYNRLVELQALICEKYGLNPLTQLYRHCDFVNTDCPGYLARHDDEWNQFKKDVKNFMENGTINSTIVNETPVIPVTGKTIAQLAQEVLNGVHGNGEDRKNSLGDRYDVVQAEVNRILNTPSANVIPKYNITAVAREVIAGKYGNGDQRRIALENIGLSYDEVQEEVNSIIYGEKTDNETNEVSYTTAVKSNGVVASIGESCVTTDYLNLRDEPNGKILFAIPEGERVEVLADGGEANGYDWVKVDYDGNTGFVASRYLR